MTCDVQSQGVTVVGERCWSISCLPVKVTFSSKQESNFSPSCVGLSSFPPLLLRNQVMEMSIYLLSPQPKELLVTMMIPSATLYTKVSSFAITSGEQDLKTLFLLVTLYYCGLREQNLVFNPTGYWWLLVVYTRTIINSVVSLPTGLKLESILHSSGW